ncbi:hypothetical protein Gorai_006268, partial [Gossypium raimondii]|nr:hypothetical protein [Gossypium raimondii]
MKRLIENYLLEFDGIKEKLPIQRIKAERWRPPETLHVKVNSNAAYNQQNKELCSGIVIRNEEGRILKAKLVEIEGDALSVIKKLQNDFED